ncbi:sensor histidine kinase [Nocardioides pacificus]
MEGMHAPTRPRAAAAVAATAWGLAALSSCVLAVVGPRLDENLWFFLVDVTVACVYGTVTAVTLGRRAHPVAWILGLTAIGGGLAALGYAGEAWWAERGGGSLPWALDAINSTAWVPGTMAIFLIVPWLVRDHPLGRARWGLAAGTGLVVIMTVGAALGIDPVVGIALVVSIPLGLVTAAAVELRRRRGPVQERNGLGWLALGTLVMAVSFVPLLLPPSLGLPVWPTPVLHLASQAVFPAAVMVAVLRGRMWGLDLVVSRAVLAGLMTVVLLALYLVVTMLFEQVLPGGGVAHVLGAGAVAVAVQPARLWLGGRVHRLVYGTAADPAHVVRRLGSQLGRQGSVDQLLADLAEDLGRSMRLESVTVVGADGPLARWGTPDPLRAGADRTDAPPSHVVPLRHRGAEVGLLEVTMPAGEALGSRGERTLAELSAVVAGAVAVVEAARDVARLRERLGSARLEERRLIRREIHDGLGPSLAGLRLGLQGARNLIATDPATAGELLDALQGELDERVSAVRELSHHLLPPVLEELGLGAALHELAARYDGSELRVSVDADPADDLPGPLAAAAYGIAVEAVVNVVRHAGARHCWITSRVDDHGLGLTVRDDGPGIVEGSRAGVGTRSMAERAAEQGGTVSVGSDPGGGTRVHADLPWREVAHD